MIALDTNALVRDAVATFDRALLREDGFVSPA